jgi:ubiquinone/menaquinone biosynthesis C-methylase UbiE
MFTDPVKNLKALGLREDSIVADLGAGTGFYSIAAGRIAAKGRVYAVEIVKDFLDTIGRKIKEANLSNVEIIWGNIEKPGGTHMGDAVADAVIASNVLFQVEHKDNFILEIKRILKPKGRVLLIDWSLAGIVGEQAIISKDRAREMFEKAGFIKDADVDAGAHHYGMIFVRQ